MVQVEVPEDFRARNLQPPCQDEGSFFSVQGDLDIDLSTLRAALEACRFVPVVWLDERWKIILKK
jgi:hypothetical protein